jgi:hypothetical protein
MQYYNSWRKFINRKVIKELLYVDNDDNTKFIRSLLDKNIKISLSQMSNYEDYIVSPFDFGFENYSQKYKNSEEYKKLSDGKFLIPVNGKLYYCDSYSDEPVKPASETERQLPILPDNWQEAHLFASYKRFDNKQMKMVAERKIRNNKDKNNILTLCVFDFDGTLFKSPEKPEGEANNWWLFAKSLDEPAAPHKPGNEWWYNRTVDLALQKIKDPSVYCIMLTGRSERFLDKRINELLLQRNLLFDEVGLNDAGEESENFKIARINEIVKLLPNLKNIEMWEDQENLAKKYQEQYGNGPYKFKVNIVDDSYSSNARIKIKIKI